MEDALEPRLAALRKGTDLAPDLIDRLGRWVRQSDDGDLYRFNPLDWARKQEIPEETAIDLLLHATKVGILELSWGAICPYCGMLVTTPGGLRALGPNPHCRVCRVDVSGTLDDSIEVVFSLAPGIRALRFHDPQRIDLRRDVERLFFSPSLRPTPHLKEAVSELAGSLRATFSLPAGATVDLEPELVADTFNILIAPSVHAVCYLSTAPGAPARLAIDCLDGQFIPDTVVAPPGKVTITLRNRSDFHIFGGVMQMGPLEEAHETPEGLPPMMEFAPFLSGKRVLTNQTFRDLFRTETIGSAGLHIKNLAVVFSDLQASTALYERVGDIRALGLVRDHFDLLHDVVARHRGAIVKTIGDAVMAAFGEPERALAAAAGMSRAVGRINADGEGLVLKIGVHQGSCIAIQTNHQIDYFGRAVNIAARVQSVAGGGEIVVTDTVWRHPGVEGLAADFGLRAREDRVQLRGIADDVLVYRLS
jgi:class 3 adenylate cyclase